MLTRLTIHNVALVDEIDLAFGPGLNVITGETGAGKSILVTAIGLALGDRPSPELTEREDARVSAWLTADGEELELTREARRDGRTKASIDGQQATISALREEGRRWVELTAQREGATLLDPESHLHHLDRYCGLLADTEKLATYHARWQALSSQLASLESKIRQHQQSEELASFQLQEIESFDPEPEEDERLASEMKLLENAEALIVGLGQSADELDQGEEPISDRLAAILDRLNGLRRVDSSLAPIIEPLEEALDALRQGALDLAQRSDEIGLDPEKLEEKRERHDQLNVLIRKYGGSMRSLLNTREQLKSRASSGEELERLRGELRRQIESHLAEWERALQRTSKKRRAEAPKMAAEMEQGLRSVGVEKPRFVVHFGDEEGDRVEFPGSGERRVGPHGWDRVEFLISFNPGHEPRPMQRVASGGELSRIMLLLKGLGPPEGNPPVFIFDEIDTGISGRTARQVGQRLKELSRLHQVLLVTHLPQIASLADKHIVVEKKTGEDSTAVSVRELAAGSDEQVEEVARLVGGDEVTEAARQTARELIQGSEK